MLNRRVGRLRTLHLIMLRKLFFLFLSISPICVLAQDSYMTGNVFDNNDRKLVLPGVAVRNLSTKAVVVTNSDGHFAIPAKRGDLLSYSSVGYQTDTVYLTNLFAKNIYLRAEVNNLQPVNITATKISPYLDLKDANATPSRQLDASKDRGGLRLNLGYGKYRREQAKINELEMQSDLIEEINKNFNKDVIQKLVNYKGEDLRDYIDLYKPTLEQVRGERPFNYTFHIATTFSEWQKLPPEARKLPPLPKLKNN
jgi:hypothetical protein